MFLVTWWIRLLSLSKLVWNLNKWIGMAKKLERFQVVLGVIYGLSAPETLETQGRFILHGFRKAYLISCPTTPFLKNKNKNPRNLHWSSCFFLQSYKLIFGKFSILTRQIAKYAKTPNVSDVTSAIYKSRSSFFQKTLRRTPKIAG